MLASGETSFHISSEIYLALGLTYYYFGWRKIFICFIKYYCSIWRKINYYFHMVLPWSENISNERILMYNFFNSLWIKWFQDLKVYCLSILLGNVRNITYSSWWRVLRKKQISENMYWDKNKSSNDLKCQETIKRACIWAGQFRRIFKLITCEIDKIHTMHNNIPRFNQGFIWRNSKSKIN